MVVYSHSRLQTFEQCPYKYKLKYVDKIPVEYRKTVEAFVGEIVHKVLEILFRRILETNQILSKGELLKIYDLLWDESWDSDILVNQPERLPVYKYVGAKMISEYYTRNYPFNDLKTIAVETEEKIELIDGNRYHIKIDRLAKDVKNNFYVIDYKTNNSMKSPEEADKDRQLAMYSIWVLRNFPEANLIYLRWEMLKHNESVFSVRTKEQLKKLEEFVVRLIKDIESTTEFIPRPSYLCKWCVYKNICEYAKKD